MPFKITNDTALLVIDVQYDFILGGALAVEGGIDIIDEINKCMKDFFKADAKVVATQDWHPKKHGSFASAHKGKEPYDEYKEGEGLGPVLWPDHCVQGKWGASFHRKLRKNYAHLILRKGYHQDIDSYSAFVENDKKTKTGLAGYLKDLGIKKIFVCGLAYDFCVKYSALDAISEGFKEVTIFTDLTKAVYNDGESMQKTNDELLKAGCKLTTYS